MPNRMIKLSCYGNEKVDPAVVTPPSDWVVGSDYIVGAFPHPAATTKTLVIVNGCVEKLVVRETPEEIMALVNGTSGVVA